MARVGDTYRDDFFVQDAAGDPITGALADISITLCEDPDGNSFASDVTLAAGDADGWYVASWELTAEGTWRIGYQYAGTPVQNFGPTVVVVESASATDTIVTTAPTSGVTRKELRQEIGRQFGQLIVLTADDGSDTTFISPRRLTYPNNAYKGRRLYFVDGTAGNLGETRDVISSTKITGTLEWSDPLPSAVQAGDEAELWGMSNAGAEPWEVEDMINDVITDSGRTHAVPVEATLAAAFDADAAEIDIPTAINWMIYQVFWQPEDSEEWVAIDRATSPGGYGYWVNRGLGTITIGGDFLLGSMDERTIKIVGSAVPATLDEDTDVTDIPKQYLVAEVCSRLATALIERNPDFAKARLQVFAQRAAIARPYIQKRPLGTGWRVA